MGKRVVVFWGGTGVEVPTLGVLGGLIVSLGIILMAVCVTISVGPKIGVLLGMKVPVRMIVRVGYTVREGIRVDGVVVLPVFGGQFKPVNAQIFPKSPGGMGDGFVGGPMLSVPLSPPMGTLMTSPALKSWVFPSAVMDPLPL